MFFITQIETLDTFSEGCDSWGQRGVSVQACSSSHVFARIKVAALLHCNVTQHFYLSWVITPSCLQNHGSYCKCRISLVLKCKILTNYYLYRLFSLLFQVSKLESTFNVYTI